MKTITNKLIIVASFLLMSVACKGGQDDQENRDIYCRFSKSETPISSQAGVGIVTVEWSYAKWEIYTKESGFITGLSLSAGGDLDIGNSSTTVKFNFTTNTTGASQRQQIYVKNIDTQQEKQIAIIQGVANPVIITLKPQTEYQEVIGFGGMLNPIIWTASNQITVEEIERMYQSGDNGLGYNILRLMVYEDHTKWDADVVTALKAQSLGAIILASPWVPPVGMYYLDGDGVKNISINKYAEYAQHLIDYVLYMRSKGVNVDIISVQNEPDMNFCKWSSQEVFDFIKEYGATIRTQAEVQLMSAESFQFRRPGTDMLLNDPETLAVTDIIGGHIYGGGLKDYPLAREKGKQVWMSEHLLNNEDDRESDVTWEQALVVAKEVHDCMEANFNTYLWWYLKRWYSMLGDGGAGTVKGEVLKRGYVMSHYAKYATGNKRIGLSIENSSGVFASAYSSQREITLVIVNQQDEASLRINLPTAAISATAIQTSRTVNMTAKEVVVSEDKNFAYIDLAKESITSLRITMQ